MPGMLLIQIVFRFVCCLLPLSLSFILYLTFSCRLELLFYYFNSFNFERYYSIQEVWKNIYLWIHSNINISTVNQIFPVRLEDVTNNSAKREGRNRFLQLSSWFLIFCKLISVYCGQSLCQNTSFPWISLWFDGFWSLVSAIDQILFSGSIHLIFPCHNSAYVIVKLLSPRCGLCDGSVMELKN